MLDDHTMVPAAVRQVAVAGAKPTLVEITTTFPDRIRRATVPVVQRYWNAGADVVQRFLHHVTMADVVEGSGSGPASGPRPATAASLSSRFDQRVWHPPFESHHVQRLRADSSVASSK